MILSLAYIISGILLVYQGIGTLGLIDGLTRVVIPAFNKNIYCFMAGVAVGKFGILLGLSAIFLGVVYLIISRKSEEVKNDNKKGRMSYFGIAMLFWIMCVVSLL